MTGPLAIALAIVAALCLGTMDYFIVIDAFLGEPARAALLLLVGLATAIAGLTFHQRWLCYAAQNVVLLLALANAYRSGLPAPGDLAQAAAAVLIGNLLMWMIVRAMPAPV